MGHIALITATQICGRVNQPPWRCEQLSMAYLPIKTKISRGLDLVHELLFVDHCFKGFEICRQRRCGILKSSNSPERNSSPGMGTSNRCSCPCYLSSLNCELDECPLAWIPATAPKPYRECPCFLSTRLCSWTLSLCHLD